MAGEPLLAPTFLFRFSAPCRHAAKLWNVNPPPLDDDCQLPCFGGLNGKPAFADVRAAWNPTGLRFSVRVVGKRQPVWCRALRIEDSDGLHLWVDTRDTHNIHRAGRFCHHFVFLPAGFGKRLDEPGGQLVPINRARENPKPLTDGQLKVRSACRVGTYHLDAMIPASCLTGFDPAEHPRLGFFYAVVDREIGWQTFGVGQEFPVMEDPSLWGSLELLPAG